MERERAFQEAARTASLESIAWLAKAASENDPSATRAAAALGSVAKREAADQLEELAGSDAPILVRANAIRALAHSGGPDNVDLLCQVAEDLHEPLRLRQEASLALAALGDPAAVPRLTGALASAPRGRDDGAEQLRISLVQALGFIGSPAALAYLRNYAAGDLSRDERAFVAKYVAED